ncbi:MAG TPA: ParB/Srx family N-terminal domain-containing protein, partial [Terricaulis sp.]|nr:ParB/Srx family N-terminal domain-containing protein [Terricaulis sp.]
MRLIIEYVSPHSVRPRARNPRRHEENQIAKLMDAIREFGFVVPVGVDDHGEIIFGHGRVEAAKRLGLKEIPIVRVRHLNRAQIRALVIADNQLAALSSWDPDNLPFELRELVLDEALDFSATITGFASAEIDAMVFGGDFASPDVETEERQAVLPAAPITAPGDVWRADGLTLVCGDALSAGAYAGGLDGERAAMAITDPPYNVKIDGNVSGKGKNKHRE